MKTHTALVFLILLLVGGGLGGEKGIVLNFQGAEIRDVATFMAEVTGKNVVVDPAVRGKMTLVFSKPVSPSEAWDIFTSALYMYGFGVVEEKGVVRIMPVGEAVTAAKVKGKPSKGEIAVLVYSLRFVDAQTVMNSIRPFLSPFARISVHAPSNSLIVADTGENIGKALRILRSLDREGSGGEVRVYRLRYLSAKEAQRIISPLNAVFSKRFGFPMVVSASEEANALVVFTSKDAHLSIEEILKKVDVEEVSAEQRSFYIIPLRFVAAEELAQSLSGLFGKGVAVREVVQRTPPAYSGDRKDQKERPPKPTVQVPRVLKTREGMRIGFDRGTNSLIVYGTRSEYEGLKRLVEKLDVRRRQVLIAATVVEASTRSLLDIGVRWQVIGRRGGAVFGGSSLTDIYASFLSGNFLIGVFSESGRTLNIGGVDVFFPDLVLLFSLLETGTGFNIISNPRVLTLDNQPAVIKVGQVVPYAEGVKFDINGQPIIIYDYKEVGLELKVTPRISGDNLRLTIDLSLQEIIDFVTNQIGVTSYTVPVTSNRTVTSDVVIENGQTVILGGLVSTKTLRSIEGVPGLWKIPLLGRLFRRDVEQEDKTTLFIFITPYIISSPEELSRITEEHRRISERIMKIIEERKTLEQEEEDDFDI
ncbi:MAG: type II secretion system secretin GspD [Aquificota bacterium]|nr:type II secretion system secretin GspD [Aquificota bacterium]